MTKDPASKLARIFANDDFMKAAPKDKEGAFFVDASPKYFGYILDFLRTDVCDRYRADSEGVLATAKDLGFQSMVKMFDEAKQERETRRKQMKERIEERVKAKVQKMGGWKKIVNFFKKPAKGKCLKSRISVTYCD